MVIFNIIIQVISIVRVIAIVALYHYSLSMINNYLLYVHSMIVFIYNLNPCTKFDKSWHEYEMVS